MPENKKRETYREKLYKENDFTRMFKESNNDFHGAYVPAVEMAHMPENNYFGLGIRSNVKNTGSTIEVTENTAYSVQNNVKTDSPLHKDSTVEKDDTISNKPDAGPEHHTVIHSKSMPASGSQSDILADNFNTTTNVSPGINGYAGNSTETIKEVHPVTQDEFSDHDHLSFTQDSEVVSTGFGVSDDFAEPTANFELPLVQPVNEGRVPIDGYRKEGGMVESGMNYVVGERGPELLRMGNSPGSIVPNDKIGGSKNYSITIENLNISTQSGNAESIVDQVREALDELAKTEFSAQAGIELD